jgi:MYXO-CTERM domain-containing protein
LIDCLSAADRFDVVVKFTTTKSYKGLVIDCYQTLGKGVLIMKSSELLKNVKLSLLALSLATLPLALPASAQTNTAPGTGTTTDTTGDTRYVRENDGFDWGWLGLLGLGGLLGLSRKREEPTRYSDPDVAGRSTTRL